MLLIYTGGAWVCYEIIDNITERLSLPEGLPVLAIILFLIGLPVVMATAFVGEVEAPGPAEAEMVTARDRLRRRRRFLTWRNAGLALLVALAPQPGFLGAALEVLSESEFEYYEWPGGFDSITLSRGLCYAGLGETERARAASDGEAAETDVLMIFRRHSRLGLKGRVAPVR